MASTLAKNCGFKSTIHGKLAQCETAFMNPGGREPMTYIMYVV